METLTNVTDSMLLALTSDSSKTQIVPRTSDAFPVRYKDSAGKSYSLSPLGSYSFLSYYGRVTGHSALESVRTC